MKNNVLIILCVGIMMFCFCSCSRKNEIIDPISEYELYLIDGISDDISIVNAEFDETNHALALTIEISDDSEDSISDCVRTIAKRSDSFLSSHYDYVLNDGYMINIFFKEESKSDSVPGNTICRLSNFNHKGLLNSFSSLSIDDSAIVNEFIIRFSDFSDINCSIFTDEQVKQVCETWVNLKTVVIDTQTRADSFSEAYPKIEFLAVRDDE